MEWVKSYLSKVSTCIPCPIFSLVLVVDSDGLLFCLNNEVKQRPSWLLGKAEKISIVEDETGTR